MEVMLLIVLLNKEIPSGIDKKMLLAPLHNKIHQHINFMEKKIKTILLTHVKVIEQLIHNLEINSKLNFARTSSLKDIVPMKVDVALPMESKNLEQEIQDNILNSTGQENAKISLKRESAGSVIDVTFFTRAKMKKKGINLSRF